ncbi:MAG: phosphoribosylanthranilate isomerase [Bacteroidales bacterium]|nr:phosphoribosylanthranilate isomerase [Bacteroidales bacterium]
MNTRVKICCIASLEEAMDAINFGASAIGLVGKMPSGPGVIDDALILNIAKSVPPPIGTFLLTSETSTDKIIGHHKITRTNTIQIVDGLSKGAYIELKQAMPGIKLVQVIHVIDKNSVDEALEVSNFVDAILLDSGNPNLKIKELGGTGRVHNWKISRKIRDKVSIPVFLAGGLTPENVRRAIEEVDPFGIDVCSSVRTEGKLDKRKLESFMKNTLF